jgi:hypothetical protein
MLYGKIRCNAESLCHGGNDKQGEDRRYEKTLIQATMLSNKLKENKSHPGDCRDGF